MTDTRCKLIINRRQELGLTQAELGKRIGVSQQQIGRIENGSPITLENAQKIAKVLGINKALLLPEGFMTDLNINVPNIKKSAVYIDMLDVTACCGTGLECIEENIIGCWNMPYDDFRTITTTSKPENVKLLRVKGDSMSPTIKDGDWVMADISLKQADSDGIYLLRMSTGLVIKRLQGSVKNDILIISDNPKYPTVSADSGEVTILGKVIYTLNAEKVG